jgi:hypothetical protein
MCAVKAKVEIKQYLDDLGAKVCCPKERIFIEFMTSGCQLKASREGSE